MKRFVLPAAVAAVLAALLCGRSFLATGQQPPPEPRPAPGQPLPSQYIPVVTPAPAPTAPKDATLSELVQLLKSVRQQKADLKREEERITEAIRRKLEEEKTLHEKVQQLLDNPGEDDEPKAARS